MNYLAYGSNLHPARLAARTPSARPERVVELGGWRLAFHKRGRDGSGKANLVAAYGHSVHAVLYRLDDREWPALLAAEGFGYAPVRLSLGADGPLAMSFLACETHVEEGLRPFDWYLDLVLEGARWHGFPRRALEHLENQVSQPDPDPGRAARYRELTRLLPDG